MKKIDMTATITVKQLIEIAANMKDLSNYYKDVGDRELHDIYKERYYCIRDILNDEFLYSFDIIDDVIDSRYDDIAVR